MSRQDNLRILVQGAGFYSHYHLDAWSRMKGVEIVGICNRSKEKAQSVAAKFGVAEVFGNLEEAISRLRPNLLDIVTPEQAHLEAIEFGARAGVDMICQKPLASSLTEAREMVNIASAAGVHLIVHENWRFAPWHQESARLVRLGAIGNPQNISFQLRPGDGRGENAYLDRQPHFRKMERFLIHETGVHIIDTFRSIMGEITGVFARLRRRNPVIAGEDSGTVLFDFASGASGIFDGDRLLDHPAENLRLTLGSMLITGDDASLRLDGYGGLWLRPTGGEEAPHPYTWRQRGAGGDNVFLLNSHIVESIRKMRPIQNTAARYLRNIEIEEAIYRSHETGMWQDLGRAC